MSEGDHLHLGAGTGATAACDTGLRHVTLDPAAADAADHLPLNPLAARLLSEEVCRQFTMLAVSFADGVVTVATPQPSDEVAHEVAASLTGREVRFVVASEEDVLAAIERTFAPPPAGLEGLAVQPARDPLRPARLGDLLVARGIATADEVDEALAEQRRTGSRLGDILMANETVREAELVAMLAEHFELPLVDLGGVTPDPGALGLIPEPLARHMRAVPIAADDRTLYLAIADALDDETVAALRDHTRLDLRGFLASRTAIDDLLQRVHGSQYVSVARSELLDRFPEESANRVVSRAQKHWLLAATATLGVLVGLFPVVTLIVLIGLASAFYVATSLYKLYLVYKTLGHTYELHISDEEVAALDERDLPTYTILVPLYREAAVLPKLTAGINGLDYPRTKLDVRLLCEEDDEETPAAIRAMNLPPHFRLVVVPDAQPKTKPKACNYGLLQADGRYCVIYDAEDIPDRDQLKKVVVAFRKADPSVVCIQAKLNYFNADQNLLTRWFTTEYSMWFDLMLPGLDATDVPIPLGGTSNHFIADRLIELAAWDPFNVTEDADLGIRLHKAGYKTAMVDSTTLEEANSELHNWLRQRSRWVKGYIQTYLVHMRHPIRLLQQIGLREWLSFQLIVGGVFILLMNPVFWTLTAVFFATEAGFIQQLFPGFVFYAAAFQLFVGNFVFMYLNVAGSLQRGYFGLAKYALLTPVYWALMSIAAWKGFLQLFYAPFYWEKTIHGLDEPAEPAAA